MFPMCSLLLSLVQCIKWEMALEKGQSIESEMWRYK